MSDNGDAACCRAPASTALSDCPSAVQQTPVAAAGAGCSNSAVLPNSTPPGPCESAESRVPAQNPCRGTSNAAAPSAQPLPAAVGQREKLTPLQLNCAAQGRPNGRSLNQGEVEEQTGADGSTDTKNEESELLSSTPSSPTKALERQGSTGSSVSRWAKLRTTVKMAGAVSSHTKKKRKQSTLMRQDSFLKRFSTRHGGTANKADSDSDDENKERKHNQRQSVLPPAGSRYVIHPDENVMFYWLATVTLSVLYNLWTCIAREAFPDLQRGYNYIWFTLDAIADTIYLLDILVQLRTGYLERGLIVYNSSKLAKHYASSSGFYIDMVALIPLDLTQIFLGIHPLIRFPRFIKFYRAYRFVFMVETRTIFPNLWRVANLTHVLFLGSHWFAGFYFMISKANDFVGEWGYPKPEGEFATLTRKYLKSLYWSTLTLTTIGDLPPPESNWEYVFTIASYLIGVFVFATIVGQVGNVITNRNASRQEFERLLDGAKSYMSNHNVPQKMQRRVQRWYDYAWSRGRMNGGGDINSLGLLPDKLKTELALHVNLVVLKKVTIFQECEPEFLHDLVLKMKAFIFTPGDLICRKGEVAREMFIIADGLLEVISDSGEVLTQMSAGDFFGEIGILNLDGGVNRRTADVRSVGYSELFVLSRDDVLSALKDHPEAEALIKIFARKRLEELSAHNKKRMDEKRAKKAASAENSPVHKILNNSAQLMAGIVQMARKHSQSMEYLDEKVNYLQPPPQRPVARAASSELLLRVLQMKRAQESASLTADEDQRMKRKSDSDIPWTNKAREAADVEVAKEADVVVNRPTQQGNVEGTDSIPGTGEHQVTVENKLSGNHKGGPKMWGLIKGLKDTTRNNGKQYHALNTEESVSEGLSKLVSEPSQVAQRDQVTISIDTEESDIDTTPDKSDEPTPMYSNKNELTTMDLTSPNYHSASEPCLLAECEDAIKAGKPMVRKYSEKVPSPSQTKSIIGPTLRNRLRPKLQKTRPNKAPVSFENPLFLNPNKDSNDDGTVGNPGKRFSNEDTNAHTNQLPERFPGEESQPDPNVDNPPHHIEMRHMGPCMGNGDIPSRTVHDNLHTGHFSDMNPDQVPAPFQRKRSRHGSKDTDETVLTVSEDARLGNSALSPPIIRLPSSPSSTNPDTSSASLQFSIETGWESEDSRRNSTHSSGSESVGGVLSRNNSMSSRPNSLLSKVNAHDGHVPKCSHLGDLLGDTDTTQSQEVPASRCTAVNAAVNTATHSSSSPDGLINSITGVLQDKLMEYECEYKSKIEQLQSENRQKEERIRQLEAQLDHLQRAMSPSASDTYNCDGQV